MSSDLSSVKSSESSGIPQIALEPSLQPLSYSTLPDAGHEKVKMKDEKAGSEESAKSNTAAASIPTEPIKRVRRKRDPVQSDSTASSTTPVKKTRKARVLSSTVRTTNSSTTIPSKVRGGAPTSTRQLEITDLVPSAAAAASSLLPTATSQNGKIEAIPKSAAFGPRSQETASANITTNPSENKTNATITSISHNSPNTMATHDQMPIYVSSGQKYDPVRAASNDNQRIPPTYTSTSHSTPQSPSMIRSPNRASASPAISSLIDPPSHSYNYSANHSTHTSPTIPFRLPTSAPTRPNPPSKPPSPLLPAAITTTTLTKDINTTPASPSAMSIDASPSSPPPPPGSAPPSTRSPTKSTVPTKRKASLPPLLALPQLPGTGATTPTSATNTAPTVVLHIPLTGASNQYVNFARLAEAAYGFAALHPRLAAQRERLARVAAAGAALEASARAAGKDEGEDLDGEECSGGEDGVVDGMDGSGDVGGGGDGAETANGGGDDDSKPRKKRKTKEETYDKDDPFVDDTELAWEEQAAASKDGFFVYSGPLVPVGETASVERYVCFGFGFGCCCRCRCCSYCLDWISVWTLLLFFLSLPFPYQLHPITFLWCRCWLCVL